ncbi:MAG: hypothetical protein WD048_03305 [Chitinophagales bacterium]
MLSVKGIYDGKNIKALEKLPKNKKYKVLITFVEEIEDSELREFSAQSDAFDFWNDPKEDIYQDYLEKK